MKTLSIGQENAQDAAHHVECLLIEVDFPTGVQRYTTAGTTIDRAMFNPGSLAVDWIGGVNPQVIAPVRETESGEATGLEIVLSGVPSSQRALILGYQIQSRRLTIWVAPMSVTTYALIDTPVKEFEGLLDAPDLEDADDGTVTIRVTVENKMARMLRSTGMRYTDFDHRQRHPSDTICRHTSHVEKTLIWPSKEFFR